MQDEWKTKDQLLQEMAALRQRVAELEKLEIEHKRVEGKLRESEEAMQALLNSAQAALFILDTTGTILALNETTAKELGKSVDELLGARIQDFLPPDLAMAKKARALEVIRSGKPVQFEDEFRGMCTENTIHPIFDDQGKVAKLAVSSRNVTAQRRAAELQSRAYEELERRVIERRADLQRANEKLQIEIAERKQVEEEVRESQQLLKKTFASLREAVFIVDGQTVQIMDCNPAVTQMFGYSREEILGQTTTFLHVDESSLQDFRKRLFATVEDKGFLHLPEFRMKRKNGEIFFTEHTVMPIEGDQGGRIGWVSVVRDITERKQVEEELRHSSEQLRSLTTRLQTIREEERGRIAREIHDELGQVLTALKMDLSWLASRLLKNQKPLVKKTESMSELVDATIQTVRKISSELRPGILDDLGLSAAIEWQAQEFQSRTGIKCRFISSREDFRLDKERSTAVFRLFQETLTNVARHAEATRVDIGLEERAGHLILKVHDNGKGITKRQISHPKSLGLLGMRERAFLFQGEVKIKGTRGKGTTVTVRIPMGKEEAEGGQPKGEGKRERVRSHKQKPKGNKH